MSIFASLLGIAVSLIFGLYKPIKTKYEEGDAQTKSAIMIAVGVFVAVVIVGASCFLHFTFVACTSAGIQSFLEQFISYFVSNQITYIALKPYYDSKQ